ncbi:uncharacterized protein LOC105354542 isoform X2 [Oryzias latipes]|uniref:uncharacterized protein LOC105354542 isoform X2 n=1 Tax=Oryzias latipes TaxID=8090 RepID=UPI0009DB693C|nr:uncharacterized protein LOC105354542 isoform X2 [Oryzias latipes]
MATKCFMLALVLMFLKTVRSEEISTQNVSCCHKNDDNVEFKHDCHNAIEMEIYDVNNITVAYASFSKPRPYTSPQGTIIDRDSVTTDNCKRHLIIKCITKDENEKIKERYIHIQFIGCGSDENTGFAVILASSLIPCIIIGLLIFFLWLRWKKKEKSQPERSENNTEEEVALEGVSSEDGPPQQRSPNGNQGDDPGGTHGSERADSLREGVRKWPDPGQEPEDGQTEGQPLLSDPRAAGAERMGEADDSVNGPGFDPFSVLAGRRPEPKSGVESKYTEEN